jgi:predicted phage terminase large subunit-like protein
VSEKDWSAPYLLAEAKKIALLEHRSLSIEHFWKIADRDLAGQAPKDISGLAARARSYAVFDAAIMEHGNAGDPDIDASIKRTKILAAKAPSLKTEAELVRFVCQTNLLFLGREVFNKLFTFFTHARLCNFFVQKNPDIGIDEQDDKKNRLLMYPRGGFKSTLDVIDCVQWIICFPDVRILVLTATKDLAKAFIEEIKNYFLIVEEAAPTTMQQLFEKFCVLERSDGLAGRFICPCRTQGVEKKKEPTAWSASIITNLPGWHCDVMKCDDVVTDKNVETPPLIAKTKKKSNTASALVDPNGYKDFIGTPYAPNDLYAHTKAKVKKLVEIWIPAWKLIPESVEKDERDCRDEDYELLFEFDKLGKTRLTHEFLRSVRDVDPDVFNSQYLLNTAGIKKIKFTRELLYARTISRDQLPTKLIYYILWDFAYGTNAGNDYSVGAVVGLDEENRIYVVEIFRDRYLDSELAREIAGSNRQYMPRLIPIENSNGAQFLESSIRRYSEEIGFAVIPLDFFKCDRSLNAKATRIGALEPLLRDARLFFLNEITCLEDLYKEFAEFGSASHDDIPDAISHVHRVLPTGSQVAEPGGPGGRERVEKFLQSLREKEFDDMIFRQGDYAPIIPQAPIEVEPESDIIDDYFSVSGFAKK